MFEFDAAWVVDLSDIVGLTDHGHDYFDPEDEENYESCGEEAA